MDYPKISKETMSHLYAGYKSLSDSPLCQKLRALIELKVSQINGCDYCCQLHHSEAVKLGIDEDKIQNLCHVHQSHHFTPAEKEALIWAENLTKLNSPPRVETTNLASYFSEREIVDLTICISLMNAFNRLAISMNN